MQVALHILLYICSYWPRAHVPARYSRRYCWIKRVRARVRAEEAYNSIILSSQ